MMLSSSHYLLFSEASQNSCSTQTWRFVLQKLGSQKRLSASDTEPETSGGERLELLAVVRGLEALDRPSRVTLVTKSRYVSRGIKHSLEEWRAGDWRWERFGRFVPVRDHDLWRRVDRALRYHQVDCQAWRFETSVDEGHAKEVIAPKQQDQDFLGCRTEQADQASCRTAQVASVENRAHATGAGETRRRTSRPRRRARSKTFVERTRLAPDWSGHRMRSAFSWIAIWSGVLGTFLRNSQRALGTTH